ncbi:MAG TPA: SymE family type I addiction module toxin [Bacteroidia bacterium]|jgi:toxic protein SymE
MTKSKFRILKVYTKFRARTFDNTTIPEIRLEGKWLDTLGFKQGQKVKVQQERHRLIITIDNSGEE